MDCFETLQSLKGFIESLPPDMKKDLEDQLKAFRKINCSGRNEIKENPAKKVQTKNIQAEIGYSG